MGSAEQSTTKNQEHKTGSKAENKGRKTKRARLGRGLGALIDQGGSPSVAIDASQPDAAVSEQSTNITSPGALESETERVVEIPVGQIVPNPHQPRRAFDEDALRALGESIRSHGLMQPIVVRRAADGGYELVAGERRWRASRQSGLATIRAVISDADDERSAELALIENIQRADLNPIERALGFSQLIERFGLTQQQLSERMGLSRSGVANILRLLDLDEELQELVARGSLSVGHAKVLLSSADADRRASLARQCIEEEWTVRLLEQQINQQPNKADVRDPGSNKNESERQDRVSSVLRDMERRMSEQLGTQVTLQTNAGGSKGRICIAFYDLDQFDGLLARLGIQSDEVQ